MERLFSNEGAFVGRRRRFYGERWCVQGFGRGFLHADMGGDIGGCYIVISRLLNGPNHTQRSGNHCKSFERIHTIPLGISHTIIQDRPRTKELSSYRPQNVQFRQT